MKIVIIGTLAKDLIGFRTDIIKLLISEGHNVYAFATDYTSSTQKQIEDLGAIAIAYSLNRTGMNPLADIADTFRLSKKLKTIKPDLLFTYNAKPIIFGTFAAQLAGIKRKIAMVEGLGFAFTEQPRGINKKVKTLQQIQVLLYRISFPFLESIIFLNPDDPKDLIDTYRLHVKKVHILGGIGVNLQNYPFSTPTLSPISFIFIGRLLAEKGIHQYVQAARIVKQRYPNVQFTVLGGIDEGNPGGLTQSDLKSLIQDNIINHPGFVSNVSDWIKNSSVFVLPSYYREGVPRSTQEAMAIGRAVITTDLPGCRETVINGRNGFLIPPWSVEALAEKFIYFINNQDQIVKMGIESHKMAQEMFDADVVNQRLLRYLVG